MFIKRYLKLIGCAAGLLLGGFGAIDAVAGAVPPQSNSPTVNVTYADLVDLADGANLVLRAQIRKQATLKPERAPDVAPGMARLYIEANTSALLAGNVPVGESLKYLVDVPLDANGKVPKLKKRDVIVFARPVPGRPGELQLVRRDAQLLWSADLEQSLRGILAELVMPDAPPPIAAIRDAISIAGNLAGESETQIFVSTKNDGPVSLTVIRRPGLAPVWGVSWSEIVDQAALPPQRGTLAWYRLACFLPPGLPRGANISEDRVSQQRAAADYQYVLDQLGTCPRNRS